MGKVLGERFDARTSASRFRGQGNGETGKQRKNNTNSSSNNNNSSKTKTAKTTKATKHEVLDEGSVNWFEVIRMFVSKLFVIIYHCKCVFLVTCPIMSICICLFTPRKFKIAPKYTIPKGNYIVFQLSSFFRFRGYIKLRGCMYMFNFRWSLDSEFPQLFSLKTWERIRSLSPVDNLWSVFSRNGQLEVGSVVECPPSPVDVDL